MERIEISDLISLVGRELEGLKLDLRIDKETLIPEVEVEKYQGGLVDDYYYKVVDRLSRRVIYKFTEDSDKVDIIGQDDKKGLLVVLNTDTDGYLMYRLEIGTGNVFRLPFLEIKLFNNKSGEKEGYIFYGERKESYENIIQLLIETYKGQPILIKCNGKYVKLANFYYESL